MTAQQRLFDAKPYVGPKATPAYQAKWRRENPERVKAYEDKRRTYHRGKSAAWRKRNPEKIKAAQRRRLLRKYGLTAQEYDRMMSDQSGLCAICGSPPTIRKTKKRVLVSLCIDHCHRSGKIRGLLCDPCNNLLGCAKDSIDMLNRAIAYLKANGR